MGMVDGSSSRYQLFRLAAKWREMQKDGRLLSNRRAVELVEERIVQLLDRIDVNEAPERVSKLYRTWQKYRKEKNDLKKYDLAQELDDIFEAAFHDYKAWEQTFEALDLRRKLIESEVKVIKDLKAMMTMEDAYEMIAQMTAIFLSIEDDPKKIRRFQQEVVKLTGDDRLPRDSIDV